MNVGIGVIDDGDDTANAGCYEVMLSEEEIKHDIPH